MELYQIIYRIFRIWGAQYFHSKKTFLMGKYKENIKRLRKLIVEKDPLKLLI